MSGKTWLDTDSACTQQAESIRTSLQRLENGMLSVLNHELCVCWDVWFHWYRNSDLVHSLSTYKGELRLLLTTCTIHFYVSLTPEAGNMYTKVLIYFAFAGIFFYDFSPFFPLRLLAFSKGEYLYNYILTRRGKIKSFGDTILLIVLSICALWYDQCVQVIYPYLCNLNNKQYIFSIYFYSI